MAGNRGGGPTTLPVHERIGLAIGLVITTIGALIIPQLPEALRAPLAFVGGLIILTALLFYMLRVVRRELSFRLITISGTLPVFYLLDEKGILLKKDIRNVSLRTATVQRIFELLIDKSSPEEQKDALRSAGLEVGTTWGEEFKRQPRSFRIRPESLNQRTDLWADYDASAGMGRLDFSLAENCTGSVILRNSFLDDRPSSITVPLDEFFSGYIEGALKEIVDSDDVYVELQEPATEHNRETTFIVKKRNTEVKD